MAVKSSTLSEAERVARQRQLGTSRKRTERERRRDSGRPDLNALDRAVVEAVRAIIIHTAPEGQMERSIPVDLLVRTIGSRLFQRAREAYKAGAEPLGYTREGVAAAIDARLFQPPASLRKTLTKEVATA